MAMNSVLQAMATELKAAQAAQKKTLTESVHTAARQGEVDVIRVLGELGADVNIPDEVGATPVYVDAQNGHYEAIRSLFKLGVHLNTPTNDGSTPVFMAAQKGHYEAIRGLFKLGTNLNTPQNNGATPPNKVITKRFVSLVS